MNKENDNIKTEYQIVLNELLSPEEISRLRETQSICGMKNAEFNKCTIRVDTDLSHTQIFPSIAAWMSYIGADQDIFCIQEIVTYYTGMALPEVKDLMRI